MLDETEIIYREEQRFALWLRAVLVVSMAFTVVFSILPLTQISPGQWRAETGQIILLSVTGVLLPIGIAVLFCFLKLETQVRPDGLYVRFVPFHRKFKRFGVDDLSEYYARQYKPIREYGGWGIRCSIRSGRAYNVSGNKGLQLVFKDGKRLLIGSQRAEELEQAIHRITEQS